VFDSQVPSLYTPSLPEITSAEEIHLLRKLSSLTEGSALEIADAAQPVVTDFSTLFHLHAAHSPRSSDATWHTRVLITVAAILALCVVYFPFHSRLRKACRSGKPLKTQNRDPSETDSSDRPQAAPGMERAGSPVESTCPVHFTRYSVPNV
jgi:hypothetical protein